MGAPSKNSIKRWKDPDWTHRDERFLYILLAAIASEAAKSSSSTRDGSIIINIIAPIVGNDSSNGNVDETHEASKLLFYAVKIVSCFGPGLNSAAIGRRAA